MELIEVNVEGENAYFTSYDIQHFLKVRGIKSYCEVRGAGSGSSKFLEVISNSKLSIVVTTSIASIISSLLNFLVQKRAGMIILQSGDKKIEVPRGTPIEDIDRYAQILNNLGSYSITCQLENTPKQKD